MCIVGWKTVRAALFKSRLWPFPPEFLITTEDFLVILNALCSTLDPLLEKLTYDYVDDGDLATRLLALFKVLSLLPTCDSA